MREKRILLTKSNGIFKIKIGFSVGVEANICGLNDRAVDEIDSWRRSRWDLTCQTGVEEVQVCLSVRLRRVLDNSI